MVKDWRFTVDFESLSEPGPAEMDSLRPKKKAAEEKHTCCARVFETSTREGQKMTAPTHPSSGSVALDGRDGRHALRFSIDGASRGKVRERLLRATAALNQTGVPLRRGRRQRRGVGWRPSTGAVRTTRDIDLLVRRSDLPVISAVLEKVGFVRDELLDIVMFRDGAEGKPSEAVHLLFTGEKTRPDHLLPSPEIQTVKDPADFPVITLERLVLMKLMSHRLKDRVHIQDLIGVRLVDRSWLPKLPPELADRLKQLLDTPDA